MWNYSHIKRRYQNNCEVLAFSGLQARETLAAGIELWVNGDSVGSWTAVLSGGEQNSIDFRSARAAVRRAKNGDHVFLDLLPSSTNGSSPSREAILSTARSDRFRSPRSSPPT